MFDSWITITVSIVFGLIFIFSLLRSILKIRGSQANAVTPNIYDEQWVKINSIIDEWITEERARTQLLDEAAGVDNPFLTIISNINFKAILINPEVDAELARVLRDTENVRSYSHFLDLVRQIYSNIDPGVVMDSQNRYFTGLSGIALGPTPYTHTPKQIKLLMEKYPWLWILETVSNRAMINTDRHTVVTTDLSESTRRGIPINNDLTSL